MELLKWNEGNNSGRGIGCVSWDGAVHADQFWRHYSFGNVKRTAFLRDLMDTSNPLMGKLKEKKKHVKGRCAECRWLDICGGTSGCGPRRLPAMSGPRTRPATSPTKRSR